MTKTYVEGGGCFKGKGERKGIVRYRNLYIQGSILFYSFHGRGAVWQGSSEMGRKLREKEKAEGPSCTGSRKEMGET